MSNIRKNHSIKDHAENNISKHFISSFIELIGSDGYFGNKNRALKIHQLLWEMNKALSLHFISPRE